METLSKPAAADATREKKLRPAPRVCDSLSLSSYKEYPARSPFINTLLHRRAQTHTHTHASHRPPSPSKAYPETNSAAILSALRNLQEKIRKLELEKGQAEHGPHGPHAMGKDASHTHVHGDRSAQRAPDGLREPRREPEQSSYNQVLISSLASAESRCAKLERQLDHMRRMLSNAKADKSSLLRQQVSAETARSADQQRDSLSERIQQEKLERLEQEYQRLTRTQTQAEIKIHELELKLQEEEFQRKLVQDKANQLQSGLEANRRLLQSVSPCLAAAPPRDRKSRSKKPVTQLARSPPHCRPRVKDVPFVAGTSVGCSHSLRANVQSVLSLLKRHQLGADGVLADTAGDHGRPDSPSSSPSSCGGELGELLQALQEELRLMSKEQDQLRKRLDEPLNLQERRDLHRAQERLLLKMERKGEQISKLYKHKTQIKKLKRDANVRRSSRNDERATTPVSSRGRSAGAAKLKPGERSRRNLMLLRDIRALQSSLHN